MRKSTTMCLLVAIALVFLRCNSDTNPLSPQALAGSYELISFTDKRIAVTFPAGVPTDDGTGVRTNLTGQLLLTQTRYELIRKHVFTQPHKEPRTAIESVGGPYSIEDGLFKVVDDASGKRDAIPITVDGNSLLLEDHEFKFEFVRE